jgi:F-type H+-transporting ATPase subunit a
VVEGFDNFIRGILGPRHGRAFAPYIMTLFLFILLNNLMGLVPLLKSSTSSLVLTASLAILTFVIVQATALVNLGPWKYLYHLLGEPKGALMWCLAPLFLFLHVIGELARPLSLALRLFGNILGEDILLGAFLAMGVGLAAFVGVPAPAPGFPLHFPFMFLVLLTSTIQALVFSLLTTIYILLVLPHDEHHGEEHGEAEALHATEHGAGHTAHGEASPA